MSKWFPFGTWHERVLFSFLSTLNSTYILVCGYKFFSLFPTVLKDVSWLTLPLPCFCYFLWGCEIVCKSKGHTVFFPGYQPSPYWSPYWICTQHPACQWPYIRDDMELPHTKGHTSNPWNKCPYDNRWANSYWKALSLFANFSCCDIFWFHATP